jgi:hypothetical protein
MTNLVQIDNLRLSRTLVREFPCPYCGAEPNDLCWGVQRAYRRESNHQERVDEATASVQGAEVRPMMIDRRPAPNVR